MSGLKLFVSHAGEDSETAARIVAYLEGRGVGLLAGVARYSAPPRSMPRPSPRRCAIARRAR
ncbi:MAG: hypothetical protein WDM79_14545 [Terricaulis sp.]